MLAFLKRWRKAYLEDKGNRLHAEVEIENSMLTKQALSLGGVDEVFQKLDSTDAFTRFAKNLCESASEVLEESSNEDCRGRRRF